MSAIIALIFPAIAGWSARGAFDAWRRWRSPTLVRARRALPPATARQIRRAARANRLEVRKPAQRWIPLAEFPDYEETR